VIECKRFIVLAGLYHHPRSWVEQYSNEFDTLDEAKIWVAQLFNGYSFYYDWFEIVDLKTKRVTVSSKSGWDKPQQDQGIANEN